jgi:hypothetical protein
MATYRGSPYEAGIGPGEGDITLFAACPPPEELGFGPATGHWRKQLRIEEVQSVWESRPVGTFRGARCLVLDDLGDRLHIGYLGHDGLRAAQLGYRQVDRGVFELIAPRDEITDIIEERTDYPRRSDTGPIAAVRNTGPIPAVRNTGPIPAVRNTGPIPAVQHSGPTGVAGQGGPLSAGPRTGPIPAVRPQDPAASHPSGPIPVPGRHEPAPARPIPAPQDSGPIPTSGRTGPIPVVQHSGPIPVSGHTGPIPVVQHSGPIPVSGHTGPIPAVQHSGPISTGRRGSRPSSSAPAAPASAGYQPQPGFPAGDAPTAVSASGVAMPAAAEAPLPLEAAAMEAAAASRRRRKLGGATLGAQRRRASARSGVDTQRVFADLAERAAIGPESYAIGAEVDGRMCLMPTRAGFEVFSLAGGAKHEVRLFTDEESAYFYLFGVLAAEAVRTGELIPGARRPG